MKQEELAKRCTECVDPNCSCWLAPYSRHHRVFGPQEIKPEGPCWYINDHYVSYEE